MNNATVGVHVFVHGPDNEIVGWVYLHEAMQLAKEANCNLHIDSYNMHAYIKRVE